MSERNTFPTSLEVRVFWEGVRFPYAEAITIHDMPEKTTCTLKIPESHAIRPNDMVGSMLHIFYANSRIKENNPYDSGPSEWPILFQGEMAGEETQRSVQSHQKQLKFVSHTRHFKQTNLYFFNPSTVNIDNDTRLDTYTAFMGASEVLFNTNAKGASKRTRIFSDLKQAIDQFEKQGGSNIAYQSVILEILRSAKDNYPYLEYIDNKLKLSERFAAYQDPDVKRLLDLTSLKIIFEQRAQKLSQNTSLMELLNVANSLLKYNWNHLSQPQIRKKAIANLEKAEQQESKREDEKAKALTASENIRAAIANQEDTATTPFGKVSLPTELNGRKTTVNAFAERLLKQIQKDNNRGVNAAANRLFVDIVPRIENDDTTSSSKKEKADKVQDDLQKSQKVNKDRLNEFLVTPNMEFAQPPKCNVILPHNMTSVGINRNYFREPTRMMGKMKFMKGQKESYTDWYIAPFTQSYFKMGDKNLEKFGPAFEEYSKEFADDIHLASLEENDEG